MKIPRKFSECFSVQIWVIHDVLVKKLVTTIFFLALHFINCQNIIDSESESFRIKSNLLSVNENRSSIIVGCEGVFSNMSDKLACVQQLLATNQTILSPLSHSKENLVTEPENAFASDDFLQFVKDGLGLEKLPDMRKINISQHEYATKYSEYLRRLRKRWQAEAKGSLAPNKRDLARSPMPFYLSLVSLAGTSARKKRQLAFANFKTGQKAIFRSAKGRDNEKSVVALNFTKKMPKNDIRPSDIEEAILKLLLMYNITLQSNKRNEKLGCGSSDSNNNRLFEKRFIRIKVYCRLPNKKRLCLGQQEIEVDMTAKNADNAQSKWLHFDVTKAVKAWLQGEQRHLQLEIKCNNCKKIGAGIYYNSFPTSIDDSKFKTNSDPLLPTLNIVKREQWGVSINHSNKEVFHLSTNIEAESKRNEGDAMDNECFTTQNKKETRCCRYPMTVVFKELRGFEFIIQPKSFDAGYCRGRCPPYYNPANHHAMLQGLIWKQSQSKIPRPCCAPSKLVELEVLHVDEKDSDKLKISTWSDMLVVECACS